MDFDHMFFFISFIKESLVTKITLVGFVLLMHLLHMCCQWVGMKCFEATRFTNVNLIFFVDCFDVPVTKKTVLELFPTHCAFMLVDTVMLIIVNFEATRVIKSFRTSCAWVLFLFGMHPIEMPFHGWFCIELTLAFTAWIPRFSFRCCTACCHSEKRMVIFSEMFSQFIDVCIFGGQLACK